MPPVPTELLLKIFDSVQNDTPESLRAVYSTSREFARVCRPMVYSELQFTAHKDKKAAPSRRAAQSMEFWCSEAIAPFVRTCIISRGDWGFRAEVVPNGLLVVFFDAIEHFRGLRKLVVDNANLDGFLPKIYHGLPALEELDVDLGLAKDPAAFTPDDAPGPTRLSRCNVIPRKSLHPFLPFFRLDNVRELNLPLKGFPGTFPNIAVLSITGRTNGGEARVLKSLARFPALEELRLSLENVLDTPLDGALIGPMQHTLKKIHISEVELLPTFIPGAARVTHIKISGEVAGCQIYHALTSVTAPSVVSFDCNLNVPDTEVITTLFSAFPHLEELHFDAYDGRNMEDEDDAYSDVRRDFFDLLAGWGKYTGTTIPATLKSLMVTWAIEDAHRVGEHWRDMHRLGREQEYSDEDENSDEDGSEESATEQPEITVQDDGAEDDDAAAEAEAGEYLLATRDAIIARMPALTSLWMDYPPYFVSLRRDAGTGTLSEEFLSIAYEPDLLGPGLCPGTFWLGPETFWASR
ncbi:L-aminoadipate-semialdehyde dehydrogenase [Mycena kentingensis (nom. inval.)]|nr:L-aminoadipate-semialdehyde dehydrogenase [Mycena kentingensis (nom. inval.)]